jgi:molybdate transport system ATP-binding protein
MADLALRLVSGLRGFTVDVAVAAAPGTLALVGPSGAGKTTVLRCVAGLRRPDAGRVAYGDRVWFDADAGVDLAPERRSVGLVPQHHALFPHLSVRDNVAFGGGDRAGELLERMRIAHLAHERPERLSGGERQRAALARALAREPDVLLLDEPLAALDAHTRAVVRGELQDVLASFDRPALLVTHDFRDAAALADRAAVMRDGRILQLGTPAELMARPADAFVAAFTGANLLVGTGRGRTVELDGGGAVTVAVDVAGRVGVALHPWELGVQAQAPANGNAVAGTVESVTAAGAAVRVRIAGLEAELAPADAQALRRGMRAWVTFSPRDARIVKLQP